MRHAVTLPVLGLPTTFESNDAEDIAAVEESFAMWRALGRASAAGETRALYVRVSVVAGDEGELARGEHAPVRYSCPDEARVVVQTPGSVAVSDPSKHEAVARVTEPLVADRAHFRAEVLEAVTLALLSHFDRHPVHAAAVARDGRAVLFAAPSGTGTSTLAHACHRDGLALMAEDQVRVQVAGRARIWGWPMRVRLRDADSSAGAKRAIDVRAGVGAERLVANDFIVCILAREGGAAALTPLDAATLARALDAQLAPGFDRFPARWPAVRDALSARGGWRLALSNDVREALPLVRSIFDSQERSRDGELGGLDEASDRSAL
jgi:hypothetical protein